MNRFDGSPADSAASAIADGGVVVRRAFSSDWLTRVAALDAPTIEGPLAEPGFLEHPVVAPILVSTLGEDYIMGRLRIGHTAAAALADLPERSALFGDACDARVPAFGLALHVALTAGTAHASAATIALAAGDVVVCDTRTRLRADGLAMLAVYYRHWFREPIGDLSAPPFAISLVTYQRLPAAQRHLFAWRFDRYLRLRPRLLLDRGLRRLPAPVADAVRRMLPGR